GAVASGATVRIGTHSATGTIVLRTETDFVSIDDDSDVDFFSFAISQPSTVNLTLTPLGATYSQGPQGGAQASVNTSIISNLGLDLFATDGTTLLQAQDLNGVGVAENITGFSLTAAGTYFAKVRGTANDIQMYQLDVSAMSVVQPGDFNADGNFNCLDINSLVGAVAGGTNPAAFDLNGDTFVNSADVTQWLALGGAANLPSQNPYLPGDANLDGVVDGSDFNAWNGNKFTSLPEWCSGDFTADGVIDGSDFNTWNINKFTSSDSAAISAVPEPISALTLLALTVLGFAGRRAA
ncbi:MAG TPA: PEP-CTERM sorting domain-containing protein, partial [Pirellulaceae bacterium]